MNVCNILLRSISSCYSEFDQLRVVDLVDTCVCGESDPEALGILLANCKELSLSCTLVNSWESVSDIIRSLDKLQTLHLA